MASGDIDDEDPFAQPVMDEEPQAAVIAEVATAPDYIRDGTPDPTVLEEGVGRIDELYVVVPVVTEDGSIYLQVAKGGVFSYYEFPWPAADRLTDEKWQQMLDNGEAPDRPIWNEIFSPAKRNTLGCRAPSTASNNQFPTHTGVTRSKHGRTKSSPFSNRNWTL